VLYRLVLFPVTLHDANYPKPPHFRLLLDKKIVFAYLNYSLNRTINAKVTDFICTYADDFQ